MAHEVAKRATDTELNEYTRLYKAAHSRKPGAALTQLREFASEHPHVFDGPSMLADVTLDAVIESASSDPAARILIQGEIDALRRSLGGDNATTLERLLIDDVAICWARLMIMEQNYSTNYSDGVTFAKAAFLERRLSATRRRYLQAIESLARVRRLLSRIGVQVNIAQQQIVTG